MQARPAERLELGLDQRPPVRLTSAWTHLDHHAEQRRLWTSPSRFRVVPAGRGSGKTEIALRQLVKGSPRWPGALRYTRTDEGRFMFGAPVHHQAKKIAWRKLKRLIPREFMSGKPSESELVIRLVNDAEIWVVGMDAPDRIEGVAFDGAILDEYGKMKEDAWPENLYPTLTRRGRPGWAWLIGVPEGRNHYYRTFQAACEPDAVERDWDGFTWKSADILDPWEVEQARRDLDELTFQQEYEASFIDFAGRVYHPFRRETHAGERLAYDPDLPLILCFDFNVDPGVCAIIQEQPYRGRARHVAPSVTAVIGEVYIPLHSNTPTVVRRVLADWGHHKGNVYTYGDPAGGNRTTQSENAGGDWKIIRELLTQHYGSNRVHQYVAHTHPTVRDRVNAVNSRLRTSERPVGLIHLLVDPVAAPHVVEDFEGTVVKEGSAGEILKFPGITVTHLSDAIGYYIERRFPVGEGYRDRVLNSKSKRG